MRWALLAALAVGCGGEPESESESEFESESQPAGPCRAALAARWPLAFGYTYSQQLVIDAGGAADGYACGSEGGAHGTLAATVMEDLAARVEAVDLAALDCPADTGRFFLAFGGGDAACDCDAEPALPPDPDGCVHWDTTYDEPPPPLADLHPLLLAIEPVVSQCYDETPEWTPTECSE